MINTYTAEATAALCAYIQDATIQNRHNDNMHVRMHTPHDFDPATSLTMVHEHGRSGSMEYPHNQLMAQAYLERGYRVIMLDATNSQNNPSAHSLEQFSIPRHRDDLADAVTYAHEAGFCKNGFALATHSMGGISALQIAASGAFKGLDHIFTYAPVTCGKKQIQARYDNLPQTVSEWKRDGYIVENSDDGKIQAKLTWEQFQAWSRHSILPDAEIVRVPIGLVAGKKDPWVPAQHVEEAYMLLPNVIDFTIIRGATHSFAENLDALKETADRVIPQLEVAGFA